MMEGMPWEKECITDPEAGTALRPDYCTLPWCFVPPDCPTSSRSLVLPNLSAVARFSYIACGNARCSDPSSALCLPRENRHRYTGQDGRCECIPQTESALDKGVLTESIALPG